MRHARVKTEGTGCYHVVSRIVDRAFKLDDGKKEIFLKMMRKAEAFSGVRVLTYAVMSNHFHLLVEVPERGEVGGAELLRRMTALYGTAYVAARTKQWDEWRKNGAGYLVDREADDSAGAALPGPVLHGWHGDRRQGVRGAGLQRQQTVFRPETQGRRSEDAVRRVGRSSDGPRTEAQPRDGAWDGRRNGLRVNIGVARRATERLCHGLTRP